MWTVISLHRGLLLPLFSGQHTDSFVELLGIRMLFLVYSVLPRVSVVAVKRGPMSPTGIHCCTCLALKEPHRAFQSWAGLHIHVQGKTVGMLACFNQTSVLAGEMYKRISVTCYMTLYWDSDPTHFHPTGNCVFLGLYWAVLQGWCFGLTCVHCCVVTWSVGMSLSYLLERLLACVL